uniref:RbsD/FucU family protein n=1 Tax=Marinobacterium profundum TaxID=1714300 RepID=UPI000836F38E|nr:RbsD/FucU domain-containing protein [Marinobacterium profundum]
MLRNIPPVLSPDLLHALRAMGHGDEIVIADANFPAESSSPKCIRLDGILATDVLRAILEVMPLDSFEPVPVLTMQVVDDADAIPEIVANFQCIIDTTADHPAKIGSLERFAFYERAKSAFAIVQTGERRLYGNIILKKGVIQP